MKFLASPEIKKSEWPFVLIMALVVSLIIITPIIYAVINTPFNYVFNGTQLVDGGDYGVYFSRIEQSRQGAIFHRYLYSGERDTAVLFLPIWIVMGWTARLFQLSSITAFYLWLIISAIILMITLYILITYFFKELWWRRLVFLITVLLTGSDWLFWPLFKQNYNFLGVNLNLPEAHVFTTMFHSPHMSLSLLLMLWTFICWLLLFDEKKIKWSILAGIFSGLLFLSHPFQIIPVLLIVFGFGLLQLVKLKSFKEWLKLLWPFLVIILLALLWIYYEYYKEPLIRAWESRIVSAYPPLPMFFTAYFPLAFLALVGLYLVIKKRLNKDYFLIFWLTIGILVLLIPNNWRLRMILGLSVVISLLAGRGLRYLVNRYKSAAFKSLIFSLLIVLALPSGLYLIGHQIYSYKYVWPTYYLPKEVVAGLVWLINLPQTAVVLASPSEQVANLIPAYSARHVYIGHQTETINFEEKLSQATDFFNGKLSSEFLLKEGIDYVFWTSQDHPLTFNQTLTPIYTNNKVIIYKVNQ